jgi:hypothetical protein
MELAILDQLICKETDELMQLNVVWKTVHGYHPFLLHLQEAPMSQKNSEYLTGMKWSLAPDVKNNCWRWWWSQHEVNIQALQWISGDIYVQKLSEVEGLKNLNSVPLHTVHAMKLYMIFLPISAPCTSPWTT